MYTKIIGYLQAFIGFYRGPRRMSTLRIHLNLETCINQQLAKMSEVCQASGIPSISKLSSLSPLALFFCTETSTFGHSLRTRWCSRPYHVWFASRDQLFLLSRRRIIAKRMSPLNCTASNEALRGPQQPRMSASCHGSQPTRRLFRTLARLVKNSLALSRN